MRRELNRLPLRSLGHLAVAKQHVGAIRQPVEAARVERHAEPDAETLAERARRRLGVRKARRWMTFEPAAEMPERHQLLFVDAAGHRPQRVEKRRRVALRENEA